QPRGAQRGPGRELGRHARGVRPRDGAVDPAAADAHGEEPRGRRGAERPHPRLRRPRRQQRHADTLFVHEVFDPATNAWTTAPRVPTGRSGVAVVVFGGEAYVFGGEAFATQEVTFREAERYDPVTNQWELV